MMDACRSLTCHDACVEFLKDPVAAGAHEGVWRRFVGEERIEVLVLRVKTMEKVEHTTWL